MINLQADKVLCAALGEDFIKCYINAKERVEIAAFPDWSPKDESDEIFEKEREMYLEYM